MLPGLGDLGVSDGASLTVGDFGFFANLYNTIITPVIAQAMNLLGPVLAAMQPIAIALSLVWMGFVGMDIANGSKTLQAATRDLFVVAMIIGALQLGQYNTYITGFFMTAAPNTVSVALGGNPNPVAALDTVLNDTVVATFKVYEALPSYSLKTIPLALAILVFLILDAIAIAFTFAVYMIAAITNVVMIVVGPVFLAAGVMPSARRYTLGWLNELVAGCTTQLLATAVITLLSGAQINMLTAVVTAAAASGSNTIAMLWGLIQCFLLMALSAAVVKKIPAMSASIAGGVYHGAQGIHMSTFGMGATAAAAGVGAARGAAGAVGKHAAGQVGSGAIRPAGKSLS